MGQKREVQPKRGKVPKRDSEIGYVVNMDTKFTVYAIDKFIDYTVMLVKPGNSWPITHRL